MSRLKTFASIYKLVAQGRLPKTGLRYAARDRKTVLSPAPENHRSSAYYGYRREWSTRDRLHYYDVSSAYPASMLKEVRSAP